MLPTAHEQFCFSSPSTKEQRLIAKTNTKKSTVHMITNDIGRVPELVTTITHINYITQSRNLTLIKMIYSLSSAFST